MERQREHHVLYHGTLSPGREIDLPVNAVRRRVITRSSVKHSSQSRSSNNAPISKERLEFEQKHCHFCQLAKFSTHETYPIGIVNDVNDETLPEDFQFVENSVLDNGVTRAEEGFRTGCECEVDSDCMLIGCYCLQDIIVSKDKSGPQAMIYAYNSKGPNKDCLRSNVLSLRDPIYECHEKCKCSLDCRNRVVERGRKIPLEIFRTDDGRGWGVRSTVKISKGQFVDKYIGEIITPKEADRRRQASDIAERKDVYLFALDKFSDSKSNDLRFTGDPFFVDGEFMSGPSRFINHSCDPNMRTFARVGEHADRHIHDLALFAIRDIPAHTELTFDYTDGLEERKDAEQNGEEKMGLEKITEDMKGDMVKCLCGSKICRGFLW